MERLFWVFPELAHDDFAERRVVDESVPLHLVDQVLNLGLSRVEAKLFHCLVQVLQRTSKYTTFSANG